MAKINCNTGCLEIISGACVKYTGPPILKPGIPTNTDFNTVIQILASTSGGGGIPSGCAKEVTYGQFRELYQTQTLAAGCWYKLTDFRTVHRILKITIDPGIWGGYSITETGETNTGPVEELFLFATSSFQEQFTGYAKNGDIIGYNLIGIDSNILAGSTHGAITRRKDPNLNISIPLDWRTVLWEYGGTKYHVFNGDNGSPSNYRNVTRDIYIGGGPEYNGYPVILFLSSSPTHADIHISRCKAFVVDKAENIHVMDSNIILPNATLYSLFASVIGKVSDTSEYLGNSYSPSFSFPE